MKAELSYADLRVKELAKLSGIKKTTIDSYLRENGYTPSVEAAVRIAGALEVSVEYLVLGKETKNNNPVMPLMPELRVLQQSLEKLDTEDRKLVIKNALNLADLLSKNRRENH